jgi:thioredoxin reductase (NADPH)
MAHEQTSNHLRDVIVIGSGAAGYTAAIYAARANLAPLIFEGSVSAGGALMTTTDVENFPGFRDGIMGPELMAEMRAQAERFGAELVADDVVEVDLTGDTKVVRTATDTFRARTVVLAMGSAYRKLGIPGEDTLSGHGVSWCATCDGFFFRDQHVAVVGGGDSALEEATFLSRFASRVTLVHRRRELRASKIMQERAFLDPKIEFAWNSTVESIHGDEKLTGVTLVDTQTGDRLELNVRGLFIAIGRIPRSELLRGQVELDKACVVVDHPSTRTNLPGVFACGDLVDHHYMQAITAAGTGCAAALDAERYIAALDQKASTAGDAAATIAETASHDPAPRRAGDPIHPPEKEAPWPTSRQ